MALGPGAPGRGGLDSFAGPDMPPNIQLQRKACGAILARYPADAGYLMGSVHAFFGP